MTEGIPWIDDGSRLTAPLKTFYKQLKNALSQEQLNDIHAYLQTETIDQLHKTLECSPFVVDSILAQPDLLLKLVRQPTLEQTFDQQFFKDCIALDSIVAEEDLHQRLRQLRRFAMCHIIWRDFNRMANLQQTTSELSQLAKSCLHAALHFHYKALTALHGIPRNAAGIAQPMLILGMGKLGADELNLSSDIDLIFTYPEAGDTDGSAPKKKLSNQEFFIQLGKKIIQALDASTADGFVFRVDMRLRPYGQSGALVSNFDALEDYYQSQGREWERYAMVKARVVAENGDVCPDSMPAYEKELSQILRSFTFRKYIDFSVIEALRGLKRMIVQEVKRRRLTDDIKLGQGGIREIEFITQVFQLIRGGRDIALQDNRLQEVLPMLEDYACLPEGIAAKLIEAYVFLRNCEHAIQAYQDKQTQRLPRSEEEQQALIKVMGFSDWPSFLSALEQHRNFVSEEFASVIALPDENNESNSADNNDWLLAWREGNGSKIFEQAGYEDPQGSEKCLEDIRQHAIRVKLHANSRERLDKFMPLLLHMLEDSDKASETLLRLSGLVKAIVRRSAYLLLLMENPAALKQLIFLTGESPWIAEQLAHYPALLDELIDPRTLYQPPDKQELQDELRRTVLRIAPEDLEAQMEALRYFRSAHGLRVAASELSGVLPLMKVSDYLTWIAEVILDYVLHLSWQEMTSKYGYPDGIESETPQFVIVGYGKLGGIELGHGSDLDLVFLHNADVNGATNGGDGKKQIENQRFFSQLGQKVIHFLSTNTMSGRLYEVDMRLRPSGNSGMLVSSLNGFAKYQQETAWTWEHQALVRARAVAGDPQLIENFNNIRKQTLCQPRDLDKLHQEVVDMRLKMRDHLGSGKKHPGEEVFDIKHDTGGIVDIEFMVQYGVLAWSHADPTLVEFTDNIRILECMQHSGRLEAQEVDQLIEAYKAYRSAGHKLALQKQSGQVDASQSSSERDTVTRIWNRLFTS